MTEYVLVPREPAQEMLRAATDYSTTTRHVTGYGYWRAMVAAAPPAPSSLRLTDLDSLAKAYASNYASPHHITFTVEGLRALLAAAAPQGTAELSNQAVVDCLYTAMANAEVPIEYRPPIIGFFCNEWSRTLQQQATTLLNGLTEEETNASASVMGLVGAPSELEAMKKNAERYLWLKSQLKEDGDDYDAFLSTRNVFSEAWPKDLNAAVDAAMAEGGKSKPTLAEQRARIRLPFEPEHVTKKQIKDAVDNLVRARSTKEDRE